MPMTKMWLKPRRRSWKGCKTSPPLPPFNHRIPGSSNHLRDDTHVPIYPLNEHHWSYSIEFEELFCKYSLGPRPPTLFVLIPSPGVAGVLYFPFFSILIPFLPFYLNDLLVTQFQSDRWMPVFFYSATFFPTFLKPDFNILLLMYFYNDNFEFSHESFDSFSSDQNHNGLSKSSYLERIKIELLFSRSVAHFVIFKAT